MTLTLKVPYGRFRGHPFTIWGSNYYTGSDLRIVNYYFHLDRKYCLSPPHSPHPCLSLSRDWSIIVYMPIRPMVLIGSEFSSLLVVLPVVQRLSQTPPSHQRSIGITYVQCTFLHRVREKRRKNCCLNVN